MEVRSSRADAERGKSEADVPLHKSAMQMLLTMQLSHPLTLFPL